MGTILKCLAGSIETSQANQISQKLIKSNHKMMIDSFDSSMKNFYGSWLENYPPPQLWSFGNTLP